MAKGYFEDMDADGCYTAGTDNKVDPYGKRMSSAGSTYVKATNPIIALSKASVNFASINDYGTAGALQTAGDLTVAGQMRDCAECHVGGGMMEYIPMAGSTDLSVGTCETRTEIYDGIAYTSNGGVACDASDQGTQVCGTYPYGWGTKNFQCEPTNSRQELRSATLTGVNTFNFFIDQYDEDDDGVIGEVIAQDYNDTGILEMDCLMCHLDGYSWEDRKDAIRTGRFDGSRATGAGIGTMVDVTGDGHIGAGDGNMVAYDPAAVGTYECPSYQPGCADAGLLTLGDTGLNVHGSTPSENCNSCHGDLHQVDWKKRGDSWTGDYQNDVHAAIGCIGCHDPSVQWEAQGTDADHGWRDYMESLNLTGQGSSNVLGHDPAKGNAPYSSLWNGTDNSIIGCAGCHSTTPTANDTFGAADPIDKHEAYGLTSVIAQNGIDGVRDVSHIQLLDCAVCHARKLGHGPADDGSGNTHGSLYEWGTGGAMVDSTGADTEGRLTDHENLYVERTMEENLCYSWQGGKLTARNALVTMFWRDKHDDFANAGAAGYVDINADGQTGAMDAVNPSHVRDAMKLAGLDVLTHDGFITDAEIGAQKTALMNYLPTVGIDLDPSGDGTPDAKLKLSFMGVTFKVNHNISPAADALGKGGCLDCHGAGTVYSGSYDLAPRDLDATWDNWSASTSAWGKHVVPFTKVNMHDYDGDSATVALGTEKADFQFSDFHPTLWTKSPTGGRSIAVKAAYGGANTIRTIDRSELLYEGDSTVLGAPGARTMVDGTTAATRAEIVANLDGVTDAVHNRHVTAGYGKCSTCHDDGASGLDLTIAGVSDLGSPFAFTTSDDGLGNPLTCSANACHGDNGFSDGNSWELASEVSVTAHLSALSDADVNNLVELNASRSNCDNGCSYAWDLDGGTLDSTNADASILTVQYLTGDYNPVVWVTDNGTGETRADTTIATGKIVEAPGVANSLTFTNDGAGTCTIAGDPEDVTRAYIYWGNRTRTVVTDPATEFPVTHSCGSTVRVKLYDAAYNTTNLIL